MKQFKRTLSLLLALLMVTGCLSGVTLTASAETISYSLYIGYTKVTSDNMTDVLGDGGSVSFDPDTNTLTLNNATLTEANGSYCLIDDNLSTWDNALTLELVGTNLIDGSNSGTAAFYGIQSAGKLNIRGSGSLTISNVSRNGIEAGTLFFDDPDDNHRPTVTVTTGRYGILARTITILNAEIHATTTGEEPNTSTSYQRCAAAAICAFDVSEKSTASLKIGAGSELLHENNVLIEADCTSTAAFCYAIVSSGSIKTTVKTTITDPANGEFGEYWLDEQTVIYEEDGNTQLARHVEITAEPFDEGYAEYPLHVDGKTVTTWNKEDVLGDGTVSYDAENNTLHLNNATVTGAYSNAYIKYKGTGSDDVLTVDLTGTSTVGSAATNCYFGFDISGANLRFTGSGSLSIGNVADDAIDCSQQDVFFDDPNACPTLNIAACRYGIRARNITLYQANLNVTSACTDTMSDNYGYKAGGIVATGTIRIGDGTMSTTRNNVHLVASCAEGENYSAIFAGSAIELPARTTVITVPEGGVVGDLGYSGKTVYDSQGNRAYQVEITAQPADPLQYGLWLNGTELTEVNLDAGISGIAFDPETNVLHVTQNVTLDQLSGASGTDCAIYSTLPDLILDIDEGCTLSLSDREIGIYALGNVHIPNGALTVTDVQTGISLDGGSLYFDGEDTARQPVVSVSASKNAIEADSVYLWNVNLNAQVTGNPGEGETAADYAAIRALGTDEGSGVLRFGDADGTAWKNNTTVNASGPQALYAQNGLAVSTALAIRLPEACLSYGGKETILDASSGAPATAVQIVPRDENAAGYNLWIAEVQVTADSRNDILGDGTMTYDPQTHTLYLEGVSYVSAVETLSTYIRYEESSPLTICLAGENSLRNDTYFFRNAYIGIECLTADLHIVGSGCLSMKTKTIGIECGDDHCLWFDDPVNRPTLTLNASETLHAKSIYMDRVELHASCRSSSSNEDSDTRVWLYAAIRAEGNGTDSGVLRIGKEGGIDNVLLDISIDVLIDEQYNSQVFAVYAKNDLILPDNEMIVTPRNGGVTHGANRHTIMEPTHDNAFSIRIEPRVAPAAVESYPLWLNGYQVNRENKNDLPGLEGSWFDSYTSTLHLTGEATLESMVVNSLGCGIYTELPELTIVLEEDCSMEMTPCFYGIYAAADCDLHIQGGGQLRMPDVRQSGIQLNGTGDLYFDGNDPELRPGVEIHSKLNGLTARNIYFWNVNLYLATPGNMYYFPIRAANNIQFGSDAAGEDWKNNAIVYATNSHRPAIIANGALTVSQKEKVWLPNNAIIQQFTDYGQSFWDPYYRESGSWGPSPSIFVSPALPDGEVPVPYDLWINGIRVTSLNQDMIPGLGGSWYDPVTTTLHLSGTLYLDYTAGAPDAGAVIDTRLETLTIQLDYAQVYINTSAEPGEEEKVNAYGIFASNNLIIQGDGRITVANSDNTAIYTGKTLTLGPGPAPTRSNYQYPVEYAEAYETWQSNLRLIPEVNVYSRTYGIRCKDLKLESVKLNAVIYANHNTGNVQVAGYRVPNAAILATGSVDIGTTTGEFYRNAVSAPEISCSFKEDEGYAIYAGAIHENSATSRIIKPTSYTITDGHYLVSSGSPVQVLSIGTVKETSYNITVEQPEDGIAGFIYLDGFEDLRARAGEMITVVTELDENYTLTDLIVEYNGTVDHLSVNQSTATFVMPASDVMIRAVVDFYGNEIIVEEAENGFVTANRSRAASGDIVTLTVTPDTGYELETLTVMDGNANALPVTDNQFIMPDTDVTVTATFRKVSYQITVDCGEYGTASADLSAATYGDVVTLTVTPNARYMLDMLVVTDTRGRRVDVDDDQFIMPASDVTVTVRFAPILFTVTILTNEHVTIEADAANAMEGDIVHLTAYGEPYVLDPTAPVILDAAGNPVAVTYDGIISARGNKWHFTMPASDVTIEPTFQYINYSIETSIYISHGTVTPSKSTAHAGETITVTVTPDEGYALERLYYGNDNDIALSNGVYSFVMPTKSITIYAKFRAIDYTVSVSEDIMGGSITADKEIANIGDTVTVTVSPDIGYALETLTYTPEGGLPVPIPETEAGYSFTMPASNVTVDATFAVVPIPYVDALDNAMEPVADYTVLTADTEELTEGWWVVTGDLSNSRRLTVSGSVNLLLCDGTTLTLPAGIQVGRNNSLTIWTQSHTEGCGKLAATGQSSCAAIGSNGSDNNPNLYNIGTIVINGGEITATGGNYAAGIGGGRHSGGGSITINNGRITASGGTNAAGIGGGQNNWSGRYGHIDSITVTGGEITATGNGKGAGIGGGGATASSAYGGSVTTITITGGKLHATSSNGYGIGPGRGYNEGHSGTVNESITLSWTDETKDTMEVYASSYFVPVTLQKPFCNRENTAEIFAGEVTDAETINAKTLIPADVPADGYYLIGPDWTVEDIDKNNTFVPNPANADEFMLDTALTVGDEIKVVHLTNGAIDTWYPDGVDNQYHVDAAHAGNVTVYFKTTYDNAWVEFGGYIWINANHVHTVAHADEVPATCTENGTKAYYYCADESCELYGKKFEDEALTVELTDVVIPATGHAYGAPEWTWTADNTAATAKFTCANCNDEQVVDAVITETVLTEAKPHVAGEKKLTATVTFEGTDYTDEKTVAIEALPCPCADFTDMPEYGTPEHEAIDWAFVNGITAGLSATEFGTNKTLNRAQAATFLYAAAGKPAVDSTATLRFNDVVPKNWYYTPVLWAASNNLVAGYENNTFRPNNTLTRAQILTILYAWAGKPSVDEYTNHYTDVVADNWYYAPAVWAYYAGIEKGENGKFGQGTLCTRATFVLYLYRHMTGNCLLND